MLNISFGCCRHSVFNTSVQLTEGRSARDKPKQLPAKKKGENRQPLCLLWKRTSLGSVLDCVAPCLEESLLSLAKLRLEEVWKSFTEHTKRVDVWLKNDSEKGP